MNRHIGSEREVGIVKVAPAQHYATVMFAPLKYIVIYEWINVKLCKIGTQISHDTVKRL